MKGQNLKTSVLLILAVILCVTACGPAFASAGDRVLFRQEISELGSFDSMVTGVCRTGDGFCVIKQMGSVTILRYKDSRSEPETFVEPEREFNLTGLNGETEPAEGEASPQGTDFGNPDGDDEDPDEDDGGFLNVAGGTENGNAAPEQDTGERLGYYVNSWFSWNDEIYGLVERHIDTLDSSKVSGIVVRHAKLEDGKVILEDSSLPELDREYLISNPGEDYEGFYGMNGTFATGNYLVGTVYADDLRRLLVFDLTDGSCKTQEIDYSTRVLPGPDGSILLSRQKVSPDYSTADYTISRMNAADLKEEPFAEIRGLLNTGNLPVCYSEKNNTLYYIHDGQVWAVPGLDPEKAEAVNGCPENDVEIMILPDGFLVAWNYSTVMLRNTDPSQKSDITLKVYYSYYDTETVNKAIYEMGNRRGDVSVVLQQDGEQVGDVLQAMMNRDSGTDIYVLPYEGTEFKALRKRGFLTDLGGSAQIAGNTDRMYPYLQEAVRKDGKIIAVPLHFTAYMVGINLDAWKKAGGTEEELPGTWDAFLDWLATLPKRLEGTDTRVASAYMSSVYFREMLAEIIMNQYQVDMDGRGGDYYYNTPMLNSLLKRVAEFDYEALGLPEEVDYDEVNRNELYNAESLLSVGGFEFFSNSSIYNTPIPLAFSENEEPVIPVNIYAGFVNPFSGHPEEAKELLALMLECRDLSEQYAIYADKTEPVESSDAAQTRENYEQNVADIKKMLEKAEDELTESREYLEESLREEEKYWEDYNRWGRWVIRPEAVAGFLKISPYLRVQESYLLRELMGGSSDNDFRKIIKGIFGYEDEENKVGDVSVEEALNLIDQKLRMMRNEGN